MCLLKLSERVIYKFFIVTIFAFLLIGCDSQNIKIHDEKADEAREVLGWLNNANPIVDALIAIENGDFRLYAYKRHHNHAIPVYEDYCPDWDDSIELMDATLSNMKFIEGAGYGEGYMTSYEYRKLNAIARLYIEEFNSFILIEISENGNFDCST